MKQRMVWRLFAVTCISQRRKLPGLQVSKAGQTKMMQRLTKCWNHLQVLVQNTGYHETSRKGAGSRMHNAHPQRRQNSDQQNFKYTTRSPRSATTLSQQAHEPNLKQYSAHGTMTQIQIRWTNEKVLLHFADPDQPGIAKPPLMPRLFGLLPLDGGNITPSVRLLSTTTLLSNLNLFPAMKSHY